MSEEEGKPGLRLVDGNDKVVPLKSRQLNEEFARRPVQSTPADAYVTEVVQLLGCSNCGSPAFKLAHDTRIVCAVCAVCAVQIMSLRWYDVNLHRTIAVSPPVA